MQHRHGQFQYCGSLVSGLTVLCLVLAACMPVSSPATGSGSLPGAATAFTIAIGAQTLGAAAAVPDEWAAWTTGRQDALKATTGLFLRKSTLVRRTALSDLTLAPPSSESRPLDAAEIVLLNATTVPICYVYISPTDAESWGRDQLGGDESIAPDAERTFAVTPGHYDLRADDCDGKVVDDVRDVNVRVRVLWVLRGEETPDPVITPEVEPTTAPRPTRTPTSVPRATRTPRPAPTPTPREADLDSFLCCGQTAGETRIWGLYYPGDWYAETIPANSERWLAASFTTQEDDVRMLIAPSSWTPMGTPMDVGDVDQYLDAVDRDQAARSSDFEEFMRRGVPGVPNARYWSASWWEGDRQFYASYLVMVTPMPYVEGMPRGTLMALGFQAEASQWQFASGVYEQMLATLQVQVIHAGPAYIAPDRTPVQSPEAQEAAEAGGSTTTFWELVFCPKACHWEYIDLANQPAGQVWQCSDGCIGTLSETPCGQCY